MTTLSDLVETVTNEKRDRVAALLAENIVAGARSLNSTELSQLNSVLEHVLQYLGNQSKKSISETLAVSHVTSSELAMRLASENTTIAAPLLANSPALHTEHLVTIAREQGQGHLLAISRRDLLDSEVTRELFANGNLEVRRSVASNIGADISPDDFEIYMQEIPYKQRKGVSDLRKSFERLIEDLRTNGSELVAGQELEDKPTNIPIKEWVNGIRNGRITLDKALARLCMEKNLSAVASLLSVVSGFPVSYMKHFTVRFDATSFAVVCKCLGVGANEYATLSRLRCTHLRLPSKLSGTWVANYNLLSETDAKRYLKRMRHTLQSDTPGTAKSKTPEAAANVRKAR